MKMIPSTASVSSLLLFLLLLLNNNNQQPKEVAAANDNNFAPLCSLCPDGSKVFDYPDRVIPFFELDENRTNPTCYEADEYARNSTLLDGTFGTFGCRLIQSQAGYCGCPNTTYIDACIFCPSSSSSSSGENNSSDEAKSSSNNNNNINNHSLLLNNKMTKPNKIVPQGDTCENIAEYTRYLSQDDCETARGQTIRAHAALCGCPGIQPICSLCSDGVTDVPDPDLEVKDGKCGEIFDFFLSVTDQSTCDSTSRLLSINGVRCGCRDKSEFPECSLRENPNLCTKELLDSVVSSRSDQEEEEQCECYSFCDDQFLGCTDFPGKLLSESGVCSDGNLITGCNYAGAAMEGLQSGATKTTATTTIIFGMGWRIHGIDGLISLPLVMMSTIMFGMLL